MSTSLEVLVAQMTVAELAQRSGKSVSQLVELAFGMGAASTPTRRAAAPAAGKPKAQRKAKGQRGAARAATPVKAAAPAKAQRGKGVDTRAPAGRDRYDATVLAAIRGTKGRAKAATLRDQVGGTPLQIRTALHRLIESGKIKAQGQARGTSYAAV